MNQFNASLWGDESFAAVLAQKPLWQMIVTVAHDTSPPFYYLWLHLWMKIFGTSEVAIRSLSFLFFLGLVVTVYFLGKRLWDKKTGLIAAALTFLNPFLFYYGFEGRMYSILALFSTLSMYFFITKQWGWYVVATLGALYSHHFSIFVILVEFIWHIKENWGKRLKEFVLSFWPFFLVGLGYVPWLYPLYYQTRLVESGFWLGKPGLKEVGSILVSFLVGSLKFKYYEEAVVALVAALLLRRWGKEKEEELLLALWLGVPIVLTFVVSHLGSSIFFDRYMLFCIPPLVLFLSSRRRGWLTAGLLGTVMVVLALADWHYFWHPTKRPFRELATFVKESKPAEAFLINYQESAHHLFESKYYGLKAPIWVPEGELPFFVGTALMEKEDVVRELPEGEVWVITSAPLEKVKIPNYSWKGYKEFGSLKVIWGEKR